METVSISESIYVIYNGELYHSGVKGMKWGIRRYQNQDGTLTAEGKRKYGKSTGKSSNYRTKLENKYKSMGMTASQARYQADRNIKIKKILAVTAAVTVAAAATYAGTKIAKEYCDRTIKSGKILKRVTSSAKVNPKHAFYATDNALDAIKYKGNYGGFELRSLQGAKDVYQHSIKVDKDIKLASPHTAKKVFKELVDKGEIKGYDNFNLTNKKQLNRAYNKFNGNLYNRKIYGENNRKFYEALKKKGYGAVHDMNDMKVSGYNSKNPMIFFDAAGKVSTNKSNKLSDKQLDKDFKKAQALIVTDKIIKAETTPSKLAYNGAWAGAIGGTTYTSKRRESIAKSMHASGKSNSEIAKSLHISESSVARLLKKK